MGAYQVQGKAKTVYRYNGNMGAYQVQGKAKTVYRYNGNMGAYQVQGKARQLQVKSSQEITVNGSWALN